MTCGPYLVIVYWYFAYQDSQLLFDGRKINTHRHSDNTAGANATHLRMAVPRRRQLQEGERIMKNLNSNFKCAQC